MQAMQAIGAKRLNGHACTEIRVLICGAGVPPSGELPISGEDITHTGSLEHQTHAGHNIPRRPRNSGP